MAETQLSERQKQVLEGIQAKKTPAEIAKEMHISVNGVHGHIRRLRASGALPKAKPRKAVKAKATKKVKTASSTPKRKPSSNGRRKVSRARLNPVVAAMRKANAAAEKRIAAIDAEVEKLSTERKELVEARKG